MHINPSERDILVLLAPGRSWGSGADGKLGLGNCENWQQPVAVPALSGCKVALLSCAHMLILGYEYLVHSIQLLACAPPASLFSHKQVYMFMTM